MARKNNTKKERGLFYIFTNGQETEYNYFTLLKSYKSIYDVKIEFKSTDPKGLIDYAEPYVSLANQVWVVFDIDNSYNEKRLLPAIQKAKKVGVRYAFSNISFEVWLISHYKQISRFMTEKQLENELTIYLKNELKKKTGYMKNDSEILKQYFVPNYKVAINNSKIVFQSKRKEYIDSHGESSVIPICEWNSSTSVYMLVEALKMEK